MSFFILYNFFVNIANSRALTVIFFLKPCVQSKDGLIQDFQSHRPLMKPHLKSEHISV